MCIVFFRLWDFLKVYGGYMSTSFMLNSFCRQELCSNGSSRWQAQPLDDLVPFPICDCKGIKNISFTGIIPIKCLQSGQFLVQCSTQKAFETLCWWDGEQFVYCTITVTAHRSLQGGHSLPRPYWLLDHFRLLFCPSSSSFQSFWPPYLGLTSHNSCGFPWSQHCFHLGPWPFLATSECTRLPRLLVSWSTAVTVPSDMMKSIFTAYVQSL